MVMFHHLPYAEAKARGEIQAKLLAELTEGLERIEEVDFERAVQLVEERLPPVDAGADRAELSR